MMNNESEIERINRMIEAIMVVAKGDFSTQLELSDKNDELDSLAMGFNLMIDDINVNLEKEKETVAELERAYEQLSNNQTAALNIMEDLTVQRKELQALNYKLEQEIAMRKKVEDNLKKRTVEIGGRINELNCLYTVSKDLTQLNKPIEDIFQEVVNRISPSMQFPKTACARITYEDHIVQTENFKETNWKMSTKIEAFLKKVGIVEVFYLEEKPASFESPFHKEEKHLINAIAVELGKYIERKHVEEHRHELLNELEFKNKELKDFAYIVSHDLKAPLRGISSLAGWIATDYADKFDDSGKEQIELLKGRVKRMHNLIEGILHYSRIGRIKQEKVKMDLNKLVPEVINLIDLPECINIQILNVLPTISFEPTRIEQIFQNLIGNSVKYMDKPDGKITIDCQENDESWTFNVKDNGPGIDEKYHNKIFQIFQTLKPRDEFESTGIGLTIVKKIIDQSGGKIWVDSKVGEGSTFYFNIPKDNYKGGIKL